ncbi:MAG: crossover junction endodeoxyribonuclease RuvC [Patescibacteria group bacterium]|nr:crossover junction endodeoxyribonuclease RuvC [Patescibacteria group bacterium]
MIILGIDPGTATTGFGVVELFNKDKIRSIEYGQVKTDKDHFMQDRLLKIHGSIASIIERTKPDVMVIERLFFNTNAKTAIQVGQARGIYLLVAGEYKLPVFEYTALQAKLTLTGYGRAEKDMVREKIETILCLKEKIKPIDASDALALAICHCIKSV